MSMDKITEFSYPIYPKRLGELLLEADLISMAQIKVSLCDQAYNPNLRLGEILAIRNWIQQETADFFARDWLLLIQEKSRNPIGWYLQQAALLKEKQINSILEEQKLTGLRFGAVAVLQGIIESTTLDFFLFYLFPEELTANPYKKLQDTTKSSTSLCEVEHLESSTEDSEFDYSEIKWID